jgi:hypothetical protein
MKHALFEAFMIGIVNAQATNQVVEAFFARYKILTA